MNKHNFLFTSLKISFAFLLAFNLSSCDKCKNVDCFTPLEPFYFQLIDKETNQNLLQNGTYKLSDIHIQSTTTNGVHTLKLDSAEIDGQKQIIVIDNEIGERSGNDYKNYIFILKDSLFNTFVYHTEKKHTDCCTYFETKEVSSPTIEITKINSNKGILYKLAL